ncbi:hypothetical protein Cni_G03614 [Canna indica]|uniref:CBS domain-containing protein n=1 Tax=Canna indica TaxID=4628 RepID=A0AAQ3JRJ7_9LILI|nr:hypothetical protein Cni_G03614 [Canna indica]
MHADLYTVLTPTFTLYTVLDSNLILFTVWTLPEITPPNWSLQPVQLVTKTYLNIIHIPRSERLQLVEDIMLLFAEHIEHLHLSIPSDSKFAMACSSIQGGLLLHLNSKNLFSNSSIGNLPTTICNSKNTRSSRIRASVFSTEDFRPQLDEYPEGIISGEWTENFSLLSYDDLQAYLESQITIHKVRPSSLLGEVMSTAIRTVTMGQTLEEVDHHFEVVSGLPVVDEEFKCIGIISRNDRTKASLGAKTKVGEVMSSPVITLSSDNTVMDAAALMLKMKIHRIPILNKSGKVIGIVTRSDILEALESVEE